MHSAFVCCVVLAEICVFANPPPILHLAPSDRIGISHCVIAAQLAGIDLSLTQEAGLVTFSACLTQGGTANSLPLGRPAGPPVQPWPRRPDPASQG